MSTDAGERWAAFAAECAERASGDDWFYAGVLPLVRAARNDPVVGALFPFRSLNRLCFSRTANAYKPQHDLPCIDVISGGTFCVERLTYIDNDSAANELTDVNTPAAALEVLRGYLDSAH